MFHLKLLIQEKKIKSKQYTDFNKILTEEYLEPYQTSNTELLVKILNSFEPAHLSQN